MNVHNILEEEVIKRVNSLYEQVKNMNVHWLTCDCEQCRLDTASYVLNRLQPKYIVSGRGMTHNASDYDSQKNADIDALIIEAMRIVSSIKRPYHDQTEKEVTDEMSGPVFNFPTFLGSVYDGMTFEPLADATVTLQLENKIAQMIDHTWANPCVTTKSTKATYTFWVKFLQAPTDNAVYHFQLDITAPGYDPVTYSFAVPVLKEDEVRKSLNSTYSLKIQDLFLFPTEK